MSGCSLQASFGKRTGTVLLLWGSRKTWEKLVLFLSQTIDGIVQLSMRVWDSLWHGFLSTNSISLIDTMQGSSYDLSIILLKHLLCLWLYVCLSVCMYVCMLLTCRGLKGYSCEAQCECWEWNLGSLQEQSVLLTAEPPLQSLICLFLGAQCWYMSVIVPISSVL